MSVGVEDREGVGNAQKEIKKLKVQFDAVARAMHFARYLEG